MAPRDDTITPAILLQHMQSMEKRILDTMEKRFSQIDARFTQVDTRFVHLEKKINLISTQISNMDARLDDLEVVQVPAIRKAVGIQ